MQDRRNVNGMIIAFEGSSIDLWLFFFDPVSWFSADDRKKGCGKHPTVGRLLVDVNQSIIFLCSLITSGTSAPFQDEAIALHFPLHGSQCGPRRKPVPTAFRHPKLVLEKFLSVRIPMIYALI